MVKISYTGKYREDFKKLLLDDINISEIVDQKVEWFYKNPNDTRLINHALTKRLKGKLAFSITKDIRIVYEWMGEKTARFLAIGPHNKVYRKS